VIALGLDCTGPADQHGPQEGLQNFDEDVRVYRMSGNKLSKRLGRAYRGPRSTGSFELEVRQLRASSNVPIVSETPCQPIHVSAMLTYAWLYSSHVMRYVKTSTKGLRDMICPEGTLVQQFISGRLNDSRLGLFEAHIDQCGECFLRVAVAAGEASDEARALLRGVTKTGSQLERCLAAAFLAQASGDEQASLQNPEPPRKRIGPYLITGFLGAGGMGIVYRAEHELLRQEVALKTVKMPLQAAALMMLRQEIEFLREARHPSIVSIVDFDFMADEPWYAMELFDGPTLKDLNARLLVDLEAAGQSKQQRLADVLRLFSRLCDPVDFIHRAGMLHCDLKPSNVFLRSGTAPVLMDFGLAARVRGTVGREALVVTGALRGSLPYMSPEMILGHIPDTRADLYALGCMLYESVVGAPPFTSASAVDLIDMHLRKPPVPASQVASGIPPELDALLLRLLAKNPHERFGHASALGDVLGALATQCAGEPWSSNRLSTPAQATTLFRPPMVGRDDELATIWGSLEKAQSAGSGALFLVSGQSGIGKTFFTTEVAQRAALAGIQVVTGECLPLVLTADAPADAGTQPLQGFRRLFEGLRERCHEQGPTEVERLFGDRFAALSNTLPFLRHLANGSTTYAPPPPLPAAAARERIVSAVVDTLVAYVHGEPLLLAIDDLHWADDLTLAVLDRLDSAILQKLPLIIIANYRSEEAVDAIRQLASRSQNREVNLERLEGAQIRALVGGMLSMSTPPESLLAYIDAYAEGIPFFAAEYLRSLVAAGALVYAGGTWSAYTNKLDEFFVSRGGQLPRTLQDLIRGRLGRLTKDSLAILEAAAVLGRRFSVPLLRRMLEKMPVEWQPLLDEAAAMQVASREGSENYSFLHDKIREVLYSGLSAQRRTDLHLAAARAIEGGSSTGADEHGSLAHHFRQGGDAMRALHYLEQAGEHALAIAASADAAKFFAEALEVEATLPTRQPALRRARWLRQRGDALGGLGRMADSATALKASAALLRRPFPISTHGFIGTLTREVLTQFWHRVRRPPRKELAGEAAQINTEVMRVFERMHEVSFYLGRDADLVLSTTVSLNSAERIEATPSLAIAYSNAAMLAGIVPVRPLADHYFRLAAAAIRAAPDLTAESWVLAMEGAYRLWQGKRFEAMVCLERAIDLARRGGAFRRSDEAECLIVSLDVLAGFHAPGFTRAARIDQSAQKRNDRQIQVWLALYRAEAHLVLNGIDAALAELSTIQPLLPSLTRPEQIWAAGVEAYIRLRRGDRSQANECVDRGISLILAGQPVHSSCLGAYDRIAETAVELFRDERGSSSARTTLARADRACSIVERVAKVFAIIRPASILHRGFLDLLRGGRTSSVVVEKWRSAAQLSRDMCLPYQELRLLSTILAHTSPHRDSEKQRVADLLTSLRINEIRPLSCHPQVTQSAA
jgi:serine/threonine protein kinase